MPAPWPRSRGHPNSMRDLTADPRRRHEPFHRTPPGLGARRHPRGRVPALPRPRNLAAGPRGDARAQARVPYRVDQRNHARRALFPRGERVHADLRAHAQRQSRPRLAVPSRRLSRLRVRQPHRRLGPQPRHRLHHHRGARDRTPVHDLPVDGRAGPSPDPSHHRDLHHPRRPHALALGRRFLPGPQPELADRTRAAAARHRGAIERRSGLSAIPAGAARHFRRRCGHRRVDVACAQPHQGRHGGARRGRRPRHAFRDRRAGSIGVPWRVRLRRRDSRASRASSAAPSNHSSPARTPRSCSPPWSS